VREKFLTGCWTPVDLPRRTLLHSVIQLISKSVKYVRTQLIRNLIIRIAIYPDRLVPSGKFVQNSTALTCLEITGYGIKYSTVLWLVELQIRPGRKVQTQVHNVNSTSGTADCQSSLFSKEKSSYPDFLLIRTARRPIIRINGVLLYYKFGDASLVWSLILRWDNSPFRDYAASLLRFIYHKYI